MSRKEVSSGRTSYLGGVAREAQRPDDGKSVHAVRLGRGVDPSCANDVVDCDVVVVIDVEHGGAGEARDGAAEREGRVQRVARLEHRVHEGTRTQWDTAREAAEVRDLSGAGRNRKDLRRPYRLYGRGTTGEAHSYFGGARPSRGACGSSISSSRSSAAWMSASACAVILDSYEPYAITLQAWQRSFSHLRRHP